MEYDDSPPQRPPIPDGYGHIDEIPVPVNLSSPSLPPPTYVPCPRPLPSRPLPPQGSNIALANDKPDVLLHRELNVQRHPTPSNRSPKLSKNKVADIDKNSQVTGNQPTNNDHRHPYSGRLSPLHHGGSNNSSRLSEDTSGRVKRKAKKYHKDGSIKQSKSRKRDHLPSVSLGETHGVYNVRESDQHSMNELEMVSMPTGDIQRPKSVEHLKQKGRKVYSKAMQMAVVFRETSFSGSPDPRTNEDLDPHGYVPPVTPSNISPNVQSRPSTATSDVAQFKSSAVPSNVERFGSASTPTIAERGESRRSLCPLDEDAWSKACPCVKSRHLCYMNVIVACTVVGLAMVLAILMVTVNIVYVEHDQVALLRSKTTGEVHDVTYYPGCYVPGVETEFIYFSSTGYWFNDAQFRIFTASQMTVEIGFKILYYIRADEIGQLYIRYGSDYQNITEKIITATIRNAAATLTLDQLRLERPLVEEMLHNVTREKLRDIHIDATYFWLGKVNIPEEVMERILKSLLLQMYSETEIFIQDQAMVDKVTEKKIQAYSNQANEIAAISEALSYFLQSKALVMADAKSQNATLQGWGGMCDLLGMTNEDYKMSLLYLHNLNKMDNVYMAPTDVNNDNFTYTYFRGFDFLHK